MELWSMMTDEENKSDAHADEIIGSDTNDDELG